MIFKKYILPLPYLYGKLFHLPNLQTSKIRNGPYVVYIDTINFHL